MGQLSEHSTPLIAIYICLMVVGFIYTRGDTDTRRDFLVIGTLVLLWVLSVVSIILGDTAEITIGAAGVIAASLALKHLLLLKLFN